MPTIWANHVQFSFSRPGPTPERLAHYYKHGWLIITDFVGSPWIPTLREAGRRVTEACYPENGYALRDVSIQGC